MRELTISRREAGQRFDKYLKKYLDEAPGSFIYKMLRKKNITLNGAKAAGSEIIAEGDVVRLFLAEQTIQNFRSGGGAPHAPQLPADWIVYEDDDLLFLNKPAGVLTQRADTGGFSLAEMLAAYANGAGQGSAGAADDTFHPSPANRLDRNTSGLVLCGKTIRGMQFLTGALRERAVRKEYKVIAHGAFEGDGIYRIFFTKDEWANRVELFEEPRPGCGEMVTGISCIRRNSKVSHDDAASLLLIDLLTGKPHQIRAHLACLGFPVVGDPKYGDAKLNAAFLRKYGVKRQMLHAARVAFSDIEGPFAYLAGEAFEAELPRDMTKLAEELRLAE